MKHDELLMQWTQVGDFLKCQWCGWLAYQGKCRVCGGNNG